MSTLWVAIGSFFAFIVAYNTYGKWLAKKVFNLDAAAEVPSKQLEDNVDFVPTRRAIVFGHHFTSIAGTGPIVGPAIAVFWGWLPALLWVLVGSIFIGAVHDFGSLIVSLRNRGQTVGEIAGRMISPRARVLFLLILFFALTVVLAIFGLVIASIFNLYPESVISVWLAMPLAVAVGFWMHRHQGGIVVPSLIALSLLYAAIYLGTNYWPITLAGVTENPIVVWTIILFIYCFFASVLPVWILLQPRDFINSQQLLVALVLLVAGIAVAGATGKADLVSSAPAVVDSSERPADAPPIWPFLFITIACGAVSGFHCLVSSGTSSKQVACESHAQSIGYGAMLLEGALAVIVILACCAGVGMGLFERTTIDAVEGESPLIARYDYQPTLDAESAPITGVAAWKAKYDVARGWNAFKLGQKVGAFIDGGANFLTALGIPLKLAVGIIAVLVACFAATTLDTATRLQRYVVQELAGTFHITPLENKYAATGFAVGLALMLAMLPGPSGVIGTGGLYLWPLFGATNQLLAGLALMVIAFYLWRRGKPVWFTIVPMLLMVVMPAWGLSLQMFHPETGWWASQKYVLFAIGGATMLLQIWMIAEAVLLWPRARGVLEESLPPLSRPAHAAVPSGGRTC